MSYHLRQYLGSLAARAGVTLDQRELVDLECIKVDLGMIAHCSPDLSITEQRSAMGRLSADVADFLLEPGAYR